MNIYEIPAMYHEMMSLVDECDDQNLQEAVDNAITEIKNDLKTHAESLGKWMSNLAAQNAGAKLELERLKALIKARENRYNAIKSGIRTAMIETDTPKIATDLYTFSLRKGSESTEVVCAELLPIDYVEVETLIKPKKAEIKKAIKEGRKNEETGELLITDKMARIIVGEKSLTVK